MLGSVLAAVGVILVVRSFVIGGEAVSRIQIMPLLIIAAAVILFGVLLQSLGLIVSLALVTIISAFASRESKPLEVAALTGVMAAFAPASILRLKLRISSAAERVCGWYSG